MRALLSMAALLGLGCQAAGRPTPPAVAADEARTLFVKRFERVPEDASGAAQRVARGLEDRLKAGLSAMGHRVIAETQGTALTVSLGGAFELHPAGDVKSLRLFLRVEEEGRLLCDWAREPESFYFLPPSERDLDRLIEEVLSEIAATLGGAVARQSRGLKGG